MLELSDKPVQWTALLKALLLGYKLASTTQTLRAVQASSALFLSTFFFGYKLQKNDINIFYLRKHCSKEKQAVTS